MRPIHPVLPSICPTALQALERANRKQLQQANSKKEVLQQVRLIVDTALMSSGGGGGGGGNGGGGGSLGVNLLGKLDLAGLLAVCMRIACLAPVLLLPAAQLSGSGKQHAILFRGPLQCMPTHPALPCPGLPLPAAHMDDHNGRSAAEKRINYGVAPLDLAPFKALRWQRRRLVEVEGGDASQQQQQEPPEVRRGAAWWLHCPWCAALHPLCHAALQPAPCPSAAKGTLPVTDSVRACLPPLPPRPLITTLLQGSQASFLPQSQQLVEQWEQEPHIMVCFQVRAPPLVIALHFCCILQ
jgi:hypothetical protein